MNPAALMPSVVSARREICAACATPCGSGQNELFLADRCAACPLPAPKWRHLGRCPAEDSAAPAPSSFGLGDAVAAIATPIARVLGLSCIDPATRELRPASPCAQRKAALNRVKL